MRERRLRIVTTGLLGQYAFGGVTWDYLQYALGFRALGHDVWYLEDTGAWAYDPVAEEPSADCAHNVRYLARIMDEFDLGDRWIYRNAADGRYHGVEAALAERVLAEADVLVNVSGACWLREATAAVPVKVFVDGDPMFTQIGLATGKNAEYVRRVRAHAAHFSFGLHVGAPDCRVPTAGLTWRPTVQPIALECWTPWWEPGGAVPAEHPASGAFTTVMNWTSYAPQEWAGDTYDQKGVEFLRFRELPQRVPQRFVVAMGQGPGRRRPTADLEAAGWIVLEPAEHLPDHRTYRTFLAASRGEWSVAKHGYVKARTGWFSCRSACYLALGRPVVVQDTGWSAHLPAGEGVLAFDDLDGAAAGVRAVDADYERHARAARRFCERHFEARRVCAALLETTLAAA